MYDHYKWEGVKQAAFVRPGERGPFDLSNITNVFDTYRNPHKEEVLKAFRPWIEEAERGDPIVLKRPDEFDQADYIDAVNAATNRKVRKLVHVQVVTFADRPQSIPDEVWWKMVCELKYESYIHNKLSLAMAPDLHGEPCPYISREPLAYLFEFQIDRRLPGLFEGFHRSPILDEVGKNVRDLAYWSIQHALIGDMVRFRRFARLLDLQRQAIGLYFALSDDLVVLSG